MSDSTTPTDALPDELAGQVDIDQAIDDAQDLVSCLLEDLSTASPDDVPTIALELQDAQKRIGELRKQKQDAADTAEWRELARRHAEGSRRLTASEALIVHHLRELQRHFGEALRLTKSLRTITEASVRLGVPIPSPHVDPRNRSWSIGKRLSVAAFGSNRQSTGPGDRPLFIHADRG